MAKMRRRPEAADELVFGVCHAFLKGDKTEDIATSFGLTREGVYPLVVEGAARNYLLLCPPPQQELTERLATATSSIPRGSTSWPRGARRRTSTCPGPEATSSST